MCQKYNNGKDSALNSLLSHCKFMGSDHCSLLRCFWNHSLKGLTAKTLITTHVNALTFIFVLFLHRLGHRCSRLPGSEPASGHGAAGERGGAARPHASHRATWRHQRYRTGPFLHQEWFKVKVVPVYMCVCIHIYRYIDGHVNTGGTGCVCGTFQQGIALWLQRGWCKGHFFSCILQINPGADIWLRFGYILLFLDQTVLHFSHPEFTEEDPLVMSSHDSPSVAYRGTNYWGHFWPFTFNFAVLFLIKRALFSLSICFLYPDSQTFCPL